MSTLIDMVPTRPCTYMQTGFGMNTLSAMVTGACKELRMLCAAMGGKKETINGLSGIGDLMLTCFSDQSRNQRCGQRLIKVYIYRYVGVHVYVRT